MFRRNSRFLSTVCKILVGSMFLCGFSGEYTSCSKKFSYSVEVSDSYQYKNSTNDSKKTIEVYVPAETETVIPLAINVTGKVSNGHKVEVEFGGNSLKKAYASIGSNVIIDTQVNSDKTILSGSMNITLPAMSDISKFNAEYYFYVDSVYVETLTLKVNVCTHAFDDDMDAECNICGMKRDVEVVEPTTEPEVTVEPTTEPEVTVEPTTEPEVTVEPTTEPEVTVEPTTEPEITVEPTTEPEVTVEPTTEPEVTVEPTTEPEVTVEPTTEPEVTVEPTTEPEVTVEPTTEPEVTVEPTTEPEVTVEPTTEPEVTVEPTTEPEITVEPTTEPEVTVEPTTEPEVTVEPTTEPEVTVEPTTEPISTTIPEATPTHGSFVLPATVTPTPVPELNVGDFVTRCYQVALDREPDADGYDYWCSNLNNGQACGAQVGFGFIFSEEYTGKNKSDEAYVTDLYTMYFGREADTEGYDYWLSKLKDGVDRQTVFAGFANSVEFYNLCKAYGVVSGYFMEGVPNGQQGGVNCFVARLYRICLDRLPDQGGQAGWVIRLMKNEVTGTECSYGFIFSPEFVNKNLENSDFVAYMYRAFFGREADQDGFDYWMNMLNDGADRVTVFDGFSGSQEFVNLCSEYGIDA